MDSNVLMLGAEGKCLLREAQQCQRDGRGGKRERRQSCFEKASACEDIDVASFEQL